MRGYRRDRGLTQEDLAELAGLSARGIRALEQGERTTPQRDTLRLLAEALGLAPEQRAAFEEAAARHGSEGVREEPAAPIGGFLGARPAGPIVARQDEVGRLLEALDEVVEGRGRLVMLAGEPGVGKTRLAQEVSVAARARGFLVASGRCYEPELSLPYYPFLDVMSETYESAPASIRTDALQRWPYIEWLLPGRSEVLGPADIGGQDVQQRLFWAVSRFLQVVAEATPLALLLDDLHWADESTLKLLQHIARHMRGSRVLLLGTYRDNELGGRHPLEQVLRDLYREGLLEDIAIRRLDEEGTASLAAALLEAQGVSEEFAHLVHRRTEGNPFFTQEVIRALVERGTVVVGTQSRDHRVLEEVEVPRSVRSAIDERVSRLTSGAQEVMQAASVLGQTFAFDDLVTVSALTEANAEQALEEGVAASLIKPAGKNQYSFNHVLTQQTLYSELSPRKRHRLHAAAGEAMAQASDTVRQRRAAQICWHFLQADRAEQALPFAMLAGDEAEAVFAHTEAEQHYRTAIDLARDLGESHRQAEGLQKLGVVLRFMTRYDEALKELEEAVELFQVAGDVEGEGRATHDLGFVHYYRGKPEQGLARVQAMMGRLESGPPAGNSSRALADLYGAMIFNLWPMARYTEILAATERAATLARAEDYERSRAMAVTVHGMALSMVAPLAEARRALDEATPLISGSGNIWWMAQAICYIGRTFVDEGEFARGREYLERSRALSQAADDRAETAWIESHLGEVSYITGDWADAHARYEAVLRAARDTGSILYFSYALMHLAELHVAQGNWQEATLLIDRGLKIAQESTAVASLRKGQRLLAEIDLVRGNPQQAVERLETVLDTPGEDWPRAFPPPVLVEAYARLGEVTRAENLVSQRIQHFRVQNHRRALAVWLRTQSVVLSEQGRWAEAAQALDEAVLLAHTLGYPYAEGLALYERGLLHAEGGEPENARASLQQAMAIFQQLGAQPAAEQAEHVARNLG